MSQASVSMRSHILFHFGPMKPPSQSHSFQAMSLARLKSDAVINCMFFAGIFGGSWGSSWSKYITMIISQPSSCRSGISTGKGKKLDPFLI